MEPETLGESAAGETDSVGGRSRCASISWDPSKGDADAPICQNFPCADNNQATLVCYHTECVRMARRPYRFYCLNCDTNQHEDAPYHTRTTVSQFQTALPYVMSINDDSTSLSAPALRRDRAGSGKRKKILKKAADAQEDMKRGTVCINLPNNCKKHVKIDGSLLRSVVQQLCLPYKMDMDYVEVVYDGSNEHVDLDNHILAFHGTTLNVQDRSSCSPKSPRSNKRVNPSVSSSRLNFNMTFRWKRDGSKKSAPGVSSDPQMERAWSSSTAQRIDAPPVTGARSLTDISVQREDGILGRSHSTASQIPAMDGVSARTNKKLAKLLGAEDSGLDARRHSGSGDDLHIPNVGKPVKMHQRSLTEQLEMFSVYGISRDDSKPVNQARSEFWLPSTWTSLTDNIKSLSKRNIDEQEAIWELLTTAVTHCERLWTLADVFRETLVILQEKGFLTQVKLDRLYLNLSHLKEIDETFWKDQLSMVFKEAKHKGHLLKASMIAECFDGFAERFSAYVEFCGNQPRLLKYLAILKKEDSEFMSYLNWCESHPTCNRLQLTDMLAAPFQRLTKYPLLLKAIMKKTNDDAAKEALQSVVGVVEKFLGKVNQHVSVCQKRAQLQAVADRLEDTFVEVPPEFEQYVVAGLNLQDRMWTTDGVDLGERELLLEDTFKLRAFGSKYAPEFKTDVVIFLFSDLLLITKQKAGGRLQLVKPPLMIYTISLTRAKDSNNALYLVEIHAVGMATGFLILQAATSSAASSFAKAVSEAQFAYRSLLLKCQTAKKQLPQGKQSGGKMGNRAFSRRLVKIPGYKHKRRNSKSSETKVSVETSSEDASLDRNSRVSSSDDTLDMCDGLDSRSEVSSLNGIDEENRLFSGVTKSMSTGNILGCEINASPPLGVPESMSVTNTDPINCQLTISLCDGTELSALDVVTDLQKDEEEEEV